MHKLGEKLSRALRRWRYHAVPIMQTGLAAGISWLLAVRWVGHIAPFFAPIAAVVCIGVSLGQRLRRAVELVVGVTVGVGVADFLISKIGTGWWQVALVVVLAMSAAVLLNGGPVIALQSGSSAVLVATLLPPTQGVGLARMEDALIGGLVGLAVIAVLPANPLHIAHRHARTVLRELAAALRGVAAAVDERDAAKAASVLARVRATQAAINDFRSAVQTGSEITMISPIYWRRRDELHRYLNAVDPLDRALRNTRVLARRALAAIRDGEPSPNGLPQMLRQFADAVDTLQNEFAQHGKSGVATRALQEAAHSVAAELANHSGFSTRVVVAQLRSIAVDLLQAVGVSRDDAVAALPPLHDEAP